MSDPASSIPSVPSADVPSDGTGDRGPVSIFERQPGKGSGNSGTSAGAGFSKATSASNGAATSATPTSAESNTRSSASATPTANAFQVGSQAMEEVIKMSNQGVTIDGVSADQLPPKFADSIYDGALHREITRQLTSLDPGGNYTKEMNTEVDGHLWRYERILNNGKPKEKSETQKGVLSVYGDTEAWPNLRFEGQESSAGSRTGGSVVAAVVLTAAGVAAAQNLRGIGV